MTDKPDTPNPTDESFDFDFYKSCGSIFTDYLEEKNCYNPLIAYHSKRVLLDYYEKLSQEDLPEDIPRGIRNPGYAELRAEVCALEVKQLPKLRPEYYLPENRFRFHKAQADAFNATWYGCLQSLRESLGKKDLHGVVLALQDIFYAFCEEGVPLKDFITFNGIFFDRTWLTRKPSAKDSGRYVDVVWSHSKAGDNTLSGWEIFIKDASQLRNYLSDCYKALGKPKTGEIGLDDFQIAFKELIYGPAKPWATFQKLQLGLQDAGRLFEKDVPQVGGKEPAKMAKSPRWSKDTFSKTAIGKVACAVNFKDEKSYRDFIDKKCREPGVSIILKTKSSKKYFVNMEWLCNELKDLSEEMILKKLKVA